MAWALHCSGSVNRRRARGFTLIEMMVVVIIVSVLAMLAIVGYRRLILSSNVSEATNMVQNIRVAQESYHSETLQYANVAATVAPFNSAAGASAGWYPSNSPNGKTLTAWGATCSSSVCAAGYDWSVLPVHVDGPVRFGYATLAGLAGGTVAPATLAVSSAPGGTVTLPTTSATDWYLIAAMCDLDNSGDAVNTHVYATSWSNQIFLDNEGY
jgi:type IV pilus assembly protein PilA